MIKTTKIKAMGRHFLNVSSFFLYCVNITLCGLFIVLLGFLACIYFNVKFTLPLSLENTLRQELKKEGIILKAKSIDFDLKANIIIEEPQLSFVATASDFLTAKRIAFNISLDSIFRAKLNLDYAYVEDGVLSPVNVDESDLSLLSNIYFCIYKKGETWSLRSFKANIGGLRADIKGSVDQRFFAKEKVEGVEKPESPQKSIEDYLKIWEEISLKLNQVKDYTDKLNYPNLSIEFRISKDELEELYCLFRAKDIDLKVKEHSLFASNIKLGLSLNSQALKEKEAMILARVKGFNVDDKFEARQLNFRTKLCYSDMDELSSFSLKDLKLWLNDLEIAQHKIDYISLETKELRLDETPECLDFYTKRGKSHLDISAKVDKNSIALDFDYFDNPQILLEIPALEELKTSEVIERLSFNEPISIWGKTSLYFKEAIDKWNLLELDFDKFEALDDVKLDGYVLGKKVHFGNERVAEVYASLGLELKKGDAFVKDIYLLSEDGWAIGGDIYQGIHSLDYIFNLVGSFEPSALNGLMASWWDMIFEQFELLAYPEVEVFVNGKWGDPDFTWVYAKIDVEKAKYNDYAFDDISLSLNVNPSIICAYDVILKGANGYANAYLAWVYDPSIGLENYLYRNIVGSVDMNFEGVNALGGDDVEDIIDLVSFDGNLSVNLDLYDKNPRRDPNFKQLIDFDFDSKSPIKVSYFNFDSIKARGNAVGSDFYIKDTEAKFFDGDLSGDFSMQKRDGENYFRAELDAKSLNQGKLLDLILEITDTQKQDDPISPSNYLGRLNSTLTAEGFLLDFESYKASGNVSIDNPELQKVSILGGVSRALEVFKIPLTTLEFTSVKSDFSLDKGLISLPNLEIKSQTSTLFGKAIYTAMTDAVSARMYFNWKIASSVPILGHIADFAFDPILDSILLVISDTFSSPSFSGRIRLFNIFNSEEKMMENIKIDDLQ